MADEDAIYVDVIPRLDEAAADEAEKKLRDKFKDAAKDIGDNVKDAFDNLGDHVKDAFSKDNIRDAIKGARETINDAMESDLGQELQQKARERVDDVVQDLAKRAGGAIGETLRDAVGGDIIDGTIDKVQSLKDSLHALHSGDITGGLKGLSDSLHGILPNDFMTHVDGVVKAFSDAHETITNAIHDTVDSGKELREVLGFAEASGGLGLLSGLSELAGPAALAGAGAYALLGPGGVSDRIGTGIYNATASDSFLFHDQGIPVPERALSPYAPTPAGISASIPGLNQAAPSTMTPASQLPSFAPYDMPDDPRNPSNQPRYVAPPIAPASTGSASVQAQEAVVSAGAASITAGSLSLGGLSLPTPQVIVQGGGARDSALSGLGMGAPKVWWNPGGKGGAAGTGAPDITSFPGHAAGGQVLPGDSPGFDNLLGMLPGGGMVGLEGGEFVVNPGATQSNLGLLQAINASDHFDIGGLLGGGTDVHESGGPLQSVLGGGGSQGKPNAAGQGPGAATSPMKAAGEPSPAQTIIPQGQGKGLGISGGILGGAEGAAAGAADMFAPGSGAAVQLGMQEANRAIEFGVKAGITAGIEAPLDTFWLSDSGLADPSHSWFGKLGLNLIGKTGGALQQNLAGLTQAPLTPGQGQGSPLGGQQKEAGPSIHIENQHNYSDTDHEANNRSLVNQMGAYQY